MDPEEIVEIVAVYFVNCYWRQLYDAALQYWESKSGELPAAYATVVDRYTHAYCSREGPKERINQHYSKIMQDILESCQAKYDQSATMSSLLDAVARYIMPQESYKRADAARKTELCRQVLVRTLMQFAIHMRGAAARVVDGEFRARAAEVSKFLAAMRDQYLELLRRERDHFAGLILSHAAGVKPTPENAASVPKQALDAMQERIKTLIGEKAAVVRQYNQAVTMLQTFRGEVKRLTDENNMLRGRLQEQTVPQAPVRRRPPAPINRPVPLQVPVPPQAPQVQVQVPMQPRDVGAQLAAVTDDFEPEEVGEPPETEELDFADRPEFTADE